MLEVELIAPYSKQSRLGEIGLHASLKSDAADLTLLIGVTAALIKTHFDVVHDAQSQIEYRPWLVQPYSAIEASWR
jgi:hypothetical protein